MHTEMVGGIRESEPATERFLRFLCPTGSLCPKCPTISVVMDANNVVNLAAWAEPSNTLVELCDQATAVFAEYATEGDTRRSDDARLVALATELMAALTRLENLPPVGGTIGRAVDVLTHVDAHSVDDVLDAISQLRRISALRANDPSATPDLPADERTAPPPLRPPQSPSRSNRSKRSSRTAPRTTSRTTRQGGNDDASTTATTPTLPGLEA